jgi:hypothetical protein
MKSRPGRIFLRAAASLVALIVVLVVVVLARASRTFDAPLPNIHASRDPKAIERGRYLVYGPAHCVLCHTSEEEARLTREGKAEHLPLAGGSELKLPFGTIYTPNLTPDVETGIGAVDDRVLARMIRHGVLHDGRAALPFMSYQSRGVHYSWLKEEQAA